MMMNLFTSFEPSSNWNLSLNWMSLMMGLLMIPTSFWLIPSRQVLMWNKLTKTMFSEFKTLKSKYKGLYLMTISLMSMIMFNNFMGLLPYVFTSTSHLTVTMALAVPMWITYFMLESLFHSKSMMAHLVPKGTPALLIPFMVCVESISNIIRPMTLAIRLSANMVAGHLLMTLLGNTGMNMNSSLMGGLIAIQMILLLLESAVSLIQSYVFAVLTTLFFSE